MLDKYTHPEVAEWHFANLSNRWTRRAFAAAGFGYPSRKQKDALGNWKPIFSVAVIEEASDNPRSRVKDEESGNFDAIKAVRSEAIAAQDKMAVVHGVNRPFFHVDVAAAVESAVANATNRVVNVSN